MRLKNIDFENLNFNAIIRETEISLNRLNPNEVLMKFHKNFCEKYY